MMMTVNNNSEELREYKWDQENRKILKIAKKDPTKIFMMEMIKELAEEAGRKVRPLAPMASCTVARTQEPRAWSPGPWRSW